MPTIALPLPNKSKAMSLRAAALVLALLVVAPLARADRPLVAEPEPMLPCLSTHELLYGNPGRVVALPPCGTHSSTHASYCEGHVEVFVLVPFPFPAAGRDYTFETTIDDPPEPVPDASVGAECEELDENETEEEEEDDP